jgi:hypothetical protein
LFFITPPLNSAIPALPHGLAERCSRQRW